MSINVFKGLAISIGECARDREVVGHPFLHPLLGVGRSIFRLIRCAFIIDTNEIDILHSEYCNADRTT